MTQPDNITKGTKPHDRLTRLCDAMTDRLDELVDDQQARDPDLPQVKAIVMLDDGVKGGIQTHGYPSMNEAIVDIFVSLQVMFRSQGRDIVIVPMPDEKP